MRNLMVILLLASCTPDTEAPSAPTIEVEPSATVARLGSDPTWGEAAFPGDAFVTDGVPQLPDQFPNVRAGEPLFERIAAIVSQRRDFCMTCNVVFSFDGEVDPGSLTGNAIIVAVEDGSEVATRHEWQAETQTLTLRPAAGTTLRPNTSYAAVLRAGVLGADGLPVRLPVGVDDRGFGADIAAITTFTTGDPAEDLRAVRRAIHATPAPRAVLGDLFSGPSLTELLGSSTTTAPGLEQPATDGESFAMRHATTAIIVTGTIDAASFLDSEGTAVGTVQRDADGAPVVTRRAEVPFVLMIPRDADLDNLPVVVAHHGFNASRTTALTLADTAGLAGWAVLGIDAYQHGDRAASAADRANAMRGVEVPDGFAETNKLDVVSRVFGFTGVPNDFTLSPEYALSAFTQFAADALSAIHFVRRGDVTQLRAVGGLETLRFDPDRVVFVGNSMGSVVGTAVIAVEPDLAGAVLNVMPGSIIETLVESGEFRPLMERVFLPLLGVRVPFDEVERSMLFDPTVDLFRWVLEPVDPLALASSRVVDNVLVQLAGHDEVAAPRPSESVVAAGGLTKVSVYISAMHGMMEVDEQVSKFAEPLIPPLARRPQLQMLENPTLDVHDEITDFLRAVAP